jgi:hypothetical protein
MANRYKIVSMKACLREVLIAVFNTEWPSSPLGEDKSWGLYQYVVGEEHQQRQNLLVFASREDLT